MAHLQILKSDTFMSSHEAFSMVSEIVVVTDIFTYIHIKGIRSKRLLILSTLLTKFTTTYLQLFIKAEAQLMCQQEAQFVVSWNELSI